MHSRFFLIPAVISVAIIACAAAKGPGVLYEADSPYNHLIVEQDLRGMRSLYFEKAGATQTQVKPGAPLDLVLPYSRTAMLSLQVVEAPKKVLILGLGGGAMPMFLRKLFPDAEIEVAELDPDVVKVAAKFFGYVEDKKLKSSVGDGRKTIAEAKGGWDLVFLDAYGKGEIPKHLATIEFLKMLKGKLAPNALVVGNVWEPASNPLYAEMVRTYSEVFPKLCVKTVPHSGNRIFFANRELPEDLVARAKKFAEKVKLPYDVEPYASVECLPAQEPGTASLLVDEK
ncbi:MAG: fused MFS/spermidine synthase [Myxococcales bacterium]